MNPANYYGLSEEFVMKAIGLAAGEWDDGAYSQSDNDSSTTWTGVSADLIYDTITVTNKGYNDLAWDSGKLDGANTIVWGNYPEQGVIAITVIWSSRVTKEILEFDMVLDTDFTWGNATEKGSAVMDLQNIVTHELGHGLGLGDVYLTVANQETMYGYAAYGETIKRSLYNGDMTGITKLMAHNISFIFKLYSVRFSTFTVTSFESCQFKEKCRVSKTCNIETEVNATIN